MIAIILLAVLLVIVIYMIYTGSSGLDPMCSCPAIVDISPIINPYIYPYSADPCSEDGYRATYGRPCRTWTQSVTPMFTPFTPDHDPLTK